MQQSTLQYRAHTTRASYRRMNQPLRGMDAASG